MMTKITLIVLTITGLLVVNMTTKKTLTQEDYATLRRLAYGEAAGAGYDTMKMVVQSAVNRLRSGRKEKGFRGNLQKIAEEGYYAVKNKNKPYMQALEGNFNDPISKKAWQEADRAVRDVIDNRDFGNVMFYFTPEEIPVVTKQGFDFTQVKPVGKQGNYQLFAYPFSSHYQRGE